MLRSVTRLFPRRLPVCRYFSEEVPKGADKEKSSALKEEEKKFEIPIHLRPYDKAKYAVPSTKLKRNPAVGFALMDIEPLPRARIMRLCYNLLEKMQEIPTQAMYRMYTEEKLKMIMKVVDQIEDVEELERALGTESIELFIVQLGGEFELFDYIKQAKPWVKKEIDPEDLEIMREMDAPYSNPRYIRGPRSSQKFLEPTEDPKP